MVTGIILIIVGALIGMLAGKLLGGSLASIVSIIGWVCSVVGVIYIILDLIGRL